MRLLSHLLKRFVDKGRLTVITADGTRHVFGSGEGGPFVTVRMHDRKVEKELFFNPELAAAEAFMDGRLTFEDGAGVFESVTVDGVESTGVVVFGGVPWAVAVLMTLPASTSAWVVV